MKSWILSGAGNTFLIEALEKSQAVPSQQKALAMCEKYQVDGYLALVKHLDNSLEYKWEFFNRDGSRAEFCGNAARCAQYYIYETTQAAQAEHVTVSAEIKTWTQDNSHWVQMPKSEVFDSNITLEVEGLKYRGFWCDTGVPHFVVKAATQELDKNLSRKLRVHPDLGPRGANVTWIQETPNSDQIKATTYERGVEDFTQACGTGALAAALYFKELKPQLKEFRVEMPGGVLSIRQEQAHYAMTGPVEKLGEWQGSQNE